MQSEGSAAAHRGSMTLRERHRIGRLLLRSRCGADLRRSMECRGSRPEGGGLPCASHTDLPRSGRAYAGAHRKVTVDVPGLPHLAS